MPYLLFYLEELGSNVVSAGIITLTHWLGKENGQKRFNLSFDFLLDVVIIA
jgi:hypothetical protein